MRSPFELLLPLFFLSLLHSSAAAGTKKPEDFHVGLILDSGSTVGKIILTSINMALSDFYQTYPASARRLQIHLRSSAGDPVDAASAAIDLMMNEKVEAIVGPQKSAEADFVADLGSRCLVPVISLTATSPAVSPKDKHYFVRATPNDGAQAPAIAAFVRAFGWRRVVVVYEDSAYGSGIVPCLLDALTEVEVRVPSMIAVSQSASDDWILKELYRLKTLQTRVFVAHVGASLASRFFPLAEEAGLMTEGFVWIVTQGLAEVLPAMDSAAVDSMEGVIAVKPAIAETKVLEEFKRRWRRRFWLENPESHVSDPTAVGLRSYDAIWALATAAEAAGNASAGYAARKTANASTDMSLLGTSISGPKILERMTKTSFDGLSGKFRLVDGEIQASKYDVANLMGRNLRLLASWTASSDWSSGGDFRSIVWPGDSTAAPSGWEEPVGEKKMRVGVPRLPIGWGFGEIMKEEIDPATNATIAGGLVIEVFEEAVRRLPYAVPLEYVAYDGEYDDILRLIALQKIDAVVGDVTVTYNRSEYVEFSLPFSERGVAMVVPVRDQKEGNGWIFLQPLEPKLWAVSGVLFFLTGGVLWVLERQVNESFRFRFVLYFVFSTLFFAHMGKVASNLSRVVIIVWLFVVLVLISSYTANLATMFTVRRLTPRYQDIDEIREKGEYVGYPKNSFIFDMLKDLKFHENQLRSYESAEEYATALEKGSFNGGVSAIVDEIPYLRVFLHNRCSNFSMTKLIRNTEGFGFAFPKGSSLAVDISQSILEMTDDNKIQEIENRWFAGYKNCPEEDTNISENVLDFKSFWGAFLVTGLASTTSFFASLVSTLVKRWRKLGPEISKMPLQRKISILLKDFYNEDIRLASSRRCLSMKRGSSVTMEDKFGMIVYLKIKSITMSMTKILKRKLFKKNN